MTIAVIGAVYSDNLGDAVLCHCTVSMLEHMVQDANIQLIDIWGNKSKCRIDYSDRRRHIIKKVCCNIVILKKLKDNIRSVQRLLRLQSINWNKYDLVVFGGGQLFQTCFINELKYISDQLSEYSIPVIYNAVGYDLMKKKDFQKLNAILNCGNIISISTRDNFQILNKLLSRKDILQNFDPAILLKTCYGIEKSNEYDECIGIGAIHLEQNNVMAKKMIIDIIKELQARKKKWQLFCNGDVDDFNIAKSILAELGENSERLAKKPETPEELISLIAGYKGVIAFRLHASVIARALSIPCVGIAWNRKVCDFYENAGILEYCHGMRESANIFIMDIERAIADQKPLKTEKYYNVIEGVMSDAIREYYLLREKSRND